MSLLPRLGKTGGRRVDNIGDYGTVAARQELREGLLCKDFSWWVSLIRGLLSSSFFLPYFALSYLCCLLYALLLPCHMSCFTWCFRYLQNQMPNLLSEVKGMGEIR